MIDFVCFLVDFEADHSNDFQPLSDVMDSSMTSDLTQIPYSDRTTNQTALDTSFISQISMPTSHVTMPMSHLQMSSIHTAMPTGHVSMPTGHVAMPTSQTSLPTNQNSTPMTSSNELPSISELHNSVLQGSELMNLVQSLPTSQTLMSLGQRSNILTRDTQMTPRLSVAQQPPILTNQQAPSSRAAPQAGLYFHSNQAPETAVNVSQQSASLWPGQPTAAAQPTNQNSLFGSNGPTIMLHPPVQRDHVTVPSQSAQSLVDQSPDSAQGHVTSLACDEKFEPLLHNASMNTTTSTGE